MRIKITETELKGILGCFESKLFYFLITHDLSEYTPMQKNAALCLRYYDCVCDEGYEGFFAKNSASERLETRSALEALGEGEHAKVLAKLEKRAEKCLDFSNIDDSLRTAFQENDEWFNEQGIYVYRRILEYAHDNLTEFFEKVKENYVMAPFSIFFWVGAFWAIFIFVLLAVFIILEPKDAVLVFATFFTLSLPGLIAMAYSKIWKASVKGDTIHFRPLFRRKRTIRFDELDKAKQLRGKLVIYAQGKRIASVETSVENYYMFAAQLQVAGKFEDPRMVDNEYWAPGHEPDVSIRKTKSEIFTAGMFFFFAVAAFVWSFTGDNKAQNIYVHAFFFVAVLGTLWYFIWCLQWKVTVSPSGITVQNVFRLDKLFAFSDLSYVVVTGEVMTIYVDKKKVARLSTRTDGYSSFYSRLHKAGVHIKR